MNGNKHAINQYLRRQLIRKWVTYILAALLFVGFMSYALYQEHGTVTKDNADSSQSKSPVKP
jgi:type II secretory pathway component PulL